MTSPIPSRNRRLIVLLFIPVLLLSACRGTPPQVSTATPQDTPTVSAYPVEPPPSSPTPPPPGDPLPAETAAPTLSPTPLPPTPLPPEEWPDRFNADSRPVDLSADGQLLLLESDRPLNPNETMSESGQAVPAPAVYLYDREAGTYERLYANDVPLTRASDLSPDGRWVVFHDAPKRIGMDGHYTGIFLLDRQTGAVEQVSVNSAGEPGNEYSLRGQVSADGRYVVFESSANNLTGTFEQVNIPHIYVRDRQAGTTVQLDLRPDGQQPNGASYDSEMTPDGRFVAFSSLSTNLMQDRGPCGEGCTPGVFLVDRASGKMERIPGSTEPLMGGPSERVSLSADGRYVAFHTTQQGDFNYRIHVYDRFTGQTDVICAEESGTCQGHSPEISADGRYVAFTNRQMYLYDRQAKELTLLSKGLDGLPGRGESGMVQRYEGYYAELELSASGQAAAFVSDAHSLLPGSLEGEPAVKPACTYYAVSMVYPCRDVFLYDSEMPGLDWVTRAAQPGIRQYHTALIPPMPEVLLEIAPPLLYIHEDQLIRQTGGQREVLGDVTEAGAVRDALRAGDWIYVAGEQAVLRVPLAGGKAAVLRRFDPPARWLSLVASADGQQAVLRAGFEDAETNDEVWFFPGGEEPSRKVFDSGMVGGSRVTLVGLHDGSLYLLPSHPFNQVQRIDLATGNTAILDVDLSTACCLAALSADGQSLAVFYWGGTATILLMNNMIDPLPLRQDIPLPFYSRIVDGFQWSPDSRSLYFMYSALPHQPDGVPFGIWRLDRETQAVEMVSPLENEYAVPVTLSADGEWYWLHMDLAGIAIAVDVHSGGQFIQPLPDGDIRLVREQPLP